MSDFTACEKTYRYKFCPTEHSPPLEYLILIYAYIIQTKKIALYLPHNNQFLFYSLKYLDDAGLH